ncbi:CsbD family protein [Paeniglutamicibacter sp. NPDC012692]|uniref:CsbD family protein n=1 Tax=Paeniglutamicibacter sp. NPDC012692 TaxID=3364388 RepID=UPI0036946142
MGVGDKISNKAKEAVGKVKEKVGDATDNESLQAEGLKDQAVAKAKQAGEHLKDAAKDVTDK